MKNEFQAVSRTRAKNTGLSFAGEIFEMSPLVWSILTALAAAVLILGKLGTWSFFSNTVSHWTLNTKVDVYQFSQRWDSLVSHLNDLPKTQLEIEQKDQQIIELKSKLADVENIFNENSKLQAETGIKYSRNYQELGVEIWGVNSGKLGVVRVNKGEVDGVKLGDVAVEQKILLGKVTKVDQYTAEVTLVESTDISLPVKTSEKSLGILTASEAGTLTVEKILQSTKVKVGDSVYSSGVNSDYPAGLYIGQVTAVSDDQRASIKEATIVSPIDFSQLTKFKLLLLPK